MKIRFHLPGLRYNFPLNMILVGMMKQYPDFFSIILRLVPFLESFQHQGGAAEDSAMVISVTQLL